MKQKPKELDWKEFKKILFQTFSKNCVIGITKTDEIMSGQIIGIGKVPVWINEIVIPEVENFIKKLLTQQRTELKEIIDLMWDKNETDKNRYSVGWNSALAELEARLKLPKINTRAELLEEIKKLELKHSINPNSPSRERKIIYNEAIRDVINLLNKKDER